MSVSLESRITGDARANTTLRNHAGTVCTFQPGSMVALTERPGSRPTELVMVARDDTPTDDAGEPIGDRVLSWHMVRRSLPQRVGWIRRMGIGVAAHLHGTTVITDVEIDDQLRHEVLAHRALFGPPRGGEEAGRIVTIAALWLGPADEAGAPIPAPQEESVEDAIDRVRKLRASLASSRSLDTGP